MHVAILDFHERKEFLRMDTNGRHSLQCKEKKEEEGKQNTAPCCSCGVTQVCGYRRREFFLLLKLQNDYVH